MATVRNQAGPPGPPPAPTEPPASPIQLHDQSQPDLTPAQKYTVIALLSLNQCISFMDQNGVCVLLPTIAASLHAESTISWAGTSSLVGNAGFHLLSGRLSDILGRKGVLMFSLLLLSVSCLAVGLAQNASMLYVFRALAGMANGGVSSMTTTTINDVCLPRERAKWQGVIGMMVGIGTILGPLIGAAFALHSTWRGLFYLLSALSLASAFLSWRLLPSKMPSQPLRETFKKIDYIGIVLSATAITLLIVAITQGGHDDTPWNHPRILAFFVIGALLLAAFVWNEVKWAKLPIVPFSIFRNRSVTAVMLQTLFCGWAFYAQVFLMPLYFQRVRGASPLMSTVHTLPMPIAQSLSSYAAGEYISRADSFLEVMLVGFSFWTLGAGVLIAADKNIPVAFVLGSLAVLGAGIGLTFNMNVTALRAHTAKEQNAVVNSCRNFVRSAGGAIGLAVSAAVLHTQMDKMPPELSVVAKDTFGAPDLATYSEDDSSMIFHVLAAASHAGFWACFPLPVFCLVACAFVAPLRPSGGHKTQPTKEADEESSLSSSRSGSEVELRQLEVVGRPACETRVRLPIVA